MICFLLLPGEKLRHGAKARESEIKSDFFSHTLFRSYCPPIHIVNCEVTEQAGDRYLTHTVKNIHANDK